MKKIVLFHLLLVCPALFCIWYFVFPYTIWYFEYSSFFSTIPDFAGLQYSFPADWAEYVGAYLLQFFCYRLGGTGIQTLFAVIVLLSADCVVGCLFKNKGMLWLSFIPLVWFIDGQSADVVLVRSLWWCVISLLVALLVSITTLVVKNKQRKVPSLFAVPTFTYLVPCLLLGGSIYYWVTNEEYKLMEKNSHIDYLVESKKWDTVLQMIDPADTWKSPVQLRWALLALSEKGLLPEKLFSYGILEPASFIFERQEHLPGRSFNSQFFEALGFDNEVIHQSFQSGIQAPHGMSFRAMRTITNACIRKKDRPMAEKYLKVMQYSSCHGQWVKNCLAYLAAMKQQEGESATETNATIPFFIGAHPFLSDMARVIDCYPDNRKVLDYLLCGLLVSKDLDKFYVVFRRFYVPLLGTTTDLPKHYKEALLMLSQKHPEIIQAFAFTQEELNSFGDFYTQLKGEPMGQQMLELKYRGGFWFYYFCMEKKAAPRL